MLSILNIPKEIFTQIRGINVTQQTFIKRLLFARQHFTSMTFKSKSLPVDSNTICFIKFSFLVYTHSVGINRSHRVRNLILNKSKRVKLATIFTRGMGGGSTEGAAGKGKSEANCLVRIMAPNFPVRDIGQVF